MTKTFDEISEKAQWIVCVLVGIDVKLMTSLRDAELQLTLNGHNVDIEKLALAIENQVDFQVAKKLSEGNYLAQNSAELEEIRMDVDGLIYSLQERLNSINSIINHEYSED